MLGICEHSASYLRSKWFPRNTARKSILQNRRDGTRNADCSVRFLKLDRLHDILQYRCCQHGRIDGSMRTMITETRRLSPVITDSTTGWLPSVKRRGKVGLALHAHSPAPFFLRTRRSRPDPFLLPRVSSLVYPLFRPFRSPPFRVPGL